MENGREAALLLGRSGVECIRHGDKSNLLAFVCMAEIGNEVAKIISSLEQKRKDDAAGKGAYVPVRRGATNFNVYFEKCNVLFL